MLPCETALSLAADQAAPAETGAVQNEEMVTGRTTVPPSHVPMWIARAKLTAQPGDARGRLVSVAAVLAPSANSSA